MSINKRLNDLCKGISCNFVMHCEICGCQPRFKAVSVLGCHMDKLTREIAVAYHIRKFGDKCASQPSVALHEKEITLLERG